ncbi:hypothetical protein [Candidatus Methylomicrobium oryzae]|uniref:hypothetical protein n=1 Tax=Candidatus Methylomicrobium oryzae TaxID=2802053 RepID=UPI0019220C23|nr:hypothetical protein [Methylomicrobium sp. RS1]MBL1262067.1 hypothetical protein [Methylomicrobium sp. RS1]
MMEAQNDLKNALISGTIVGIATAITGALCAVVGQRNPITPMNAVSHIVWGQSALWQDKLSLKYSGTGALLHYFSSVWWAYIYEHWFGKEAEKRGVAKGLQNGAAVSAIAYVTDYHLIPKRLSPGIETRLPKYSLWVIFGTIALTLPLRGLIKKYQHK